MDLKIVFLLFLQKKFETPIDVLDVNTLEDNLKMTESLDNMDDDQLNEVIDYVANNKNNISYRSTDSFSSVENQLKVAWKAAAKIARNNGYPLSGTLVEYSVDGMRYYEANGAFSTLVNNWGYLNQHIDVLKPINVSIEMQK